MTGTAATDAPELTERQIWGIVVTLMAGMFMSTLEVLIVVPAVPTIAGELGGGGLVAWMITAYLLATTIAGPLYGKLSDLMGRKRLYEAGIVIFIAGSILAGISQDIYQLILARAIQGVGAGGLAVLATAMIADAAPPRQRARYQGVLAINFAVASVLGPLVGGLFVDYASWRYMFLINVPLGLAALVAAHRMPLRYHPRAGRVPIDFIGSAMLAGMATCLLLMVTWGGDKYSWGSPAIITLGLMATAFTGLLVVQEHRAAEPIIPPHLFRSRYFNLIVVGTMFISIPMYSGWILMPIFFQVVTLATATTAGLLLLPFVFGNTVATVVTGQLVARWDRYKWAPVTGSLVATIGFFLYASMGADTTRLVAAVFMFVAGVGIGMIQQVVVVMVQNSVRREDIGSATSTITFLRSLGFSVGSALGYSIFIRSFTEERDRLIPEAAQRLIPEEALRGSPAALRDLAGETQSLLVDAYSNGLQTAFLVLAPLGLVSFFIFLGLRDIRTEDPASHIKHDLSDVS